MDKNLQKRAEIAKRIAFLLEKKGMNQTELGNKSGFPKSYISGLLHCTQSPTVESIVRLEEALGAKILVVPRD